MRLIAFVVIVEVNNALLIVVVITERQTEGQTEVRIRLGTSSFNLGAAVCGNCVDWEMLILITQWPRALIAQAVERLSRIGTKRFIVGSNPTRTHF